MVASNTELQKKWDAERAERERVYKNWNAERGEKPPLRPCTTPADGAAVTRGDWNQMWRELEKLNGSKVSSPATESGIGGNYVFRALAWAVGVLIAGSAFIFAAGGWWDQNASKEDLNKRAAPIEARIDKIEKALIPIQTGVKLLVDDRNDAKRLSRMKRKLQSFDDEFNAALTTWKKHRRRGARPRKVPQHLKLESDVQAAEDKL